MRPITFDDARRALTLRPDDGFDVLAAQALMSPQPRPLSPPSGVTARQSAVLILLYEHEDDGALSFPLIVRPVYPGVHSGQVAFPGGRQEPDETHMETALREADEELGIVPGDVTVLGALTPIYVPPSNFMIHAFVGQIGYVPAWRPHAREVAGVVVAPLAALFDDSRKGEDTLTRPEGTFRIRYYTIGGHRVWGATAALLGEFEARLRAVMT